MRILVTGACGSLMRAVVPRLIEQGHSIRGVDNYMRYGQQDPPAGIEFLEGDLTEPATVRRALEGMDGVIQAAAQIFGVAGFHRYPADILQRDTLLHGLILREALEHQVQRVVYVSSSMVYERQPSVAREADVPNTQVPLTDYGLSKLVGERLSQAFAAQYGLSYTIWRPSNIIGLHELPRVGPQPGDPATEGPGYRTEGEDPGVSHVFADFIQRIVVEHQNPVFMLGSGEQIRCFTWIEDVAEAIAGYSFASVTHNNDFNLGNPEPVTMIELAQRVYRIYREMIGMVGEPLSFTHAPAPADDVQVRIPSIEKARSVLGWEPSVELDEMLRCCVAHELQYSTAQP